MPKIAKEYEQVVRGHIRRLLIMDGNMTNLELVKQLNQIGIPFAIEYVSKLRRKVIQQKLSERKSWVLTQYLQHFADTMNEADRKLWQIATDKGSKDGDRIYALSQIRENRKAVFDKLFEAGIFEKELGNLKIHTLMDLVRDAANITDATIIETKGIRADSRALESQPRGGDQGPVGEGLADLVRASADSASTPPPPQDSDT